MHMRLLLIGKKSELEIFFFLKSKFCCFAVYIGAKLKIGGGGNFCRARCFSVGLSKILRREPDWLAQKNH